MKKVTIIIPNFNGENLLPECLNSIFKQNFKDFDVLVVDDCSTDRSLNILENYDVKVILNNENLGFAETVNKGIRKAKTEYVLLLNNDVVLKEDFLSNLYEPMKLSSKIFSLSPKMIRYREPELLDDTGDEYTLLGWTYKRGDGSPVNTYNEVTPIFSTCAGAGLYRKSIINEIGYLDPLHYAYLEDVDLGWRALINGYKNYYIPEAQCFHIGSATLADGNKYSEQKVNLSARNNIYIIYKNMPLLQLIVNLPFLGLGFLIKYLYFSSKGYKEAYVSGLKEGFKNIRTLKRVPYKIENTAHYFQIESSMTVSTLKYCFTKTKQFIKKGVSFIKERFTKKRETAVD